MRDQSHPCRKVNILRTTGEEGLSQIKGDSSAAAAQGSAAETEGQAERITTKDITGAAAKVC